MTDSDASDPDESGSEGDVPAGAAGVSSNVGMCQLMMGTHQKILHLIRFSKCDGPQTWGQKILDLTVLLI